MIFQRTKEFATQLDREDPLREYRTRFHIPHRDEKVVIYFCGNSYAIGRH